MKSLVREIHRLPLLGPFRNAFNIAFMFILSFRNIQFFELEQVGAQQDGMKMTLGSLAQNLKGAKEDSPWLLL